MEPTIEDQAVELMRGMVQHAPTYNVIPPPILDWYMRLRKRDLEQALKAGTDGMAIVQDIAVIEFTLEAMRHPLSR
jgi:hypothetical protein